jgi:hypothetical protein
LGIRKLREKLVRKSEESIFLKEFDQKPLSNGQPTSKISEKYKEV